MLIISIVDVSLLRRVFSTSPWTLWHCLLLLLCPLILLGAEELRKMWFRQRSNLI